MSRLSRGRARVNTMRVMDPPEVSRAYARLMRAWPTQYERAARTVVRYSPTARTILDVGSGPGQLLIRLARRYPNATVTGLDAATEMIAIAREQAGLAGVDDRIALVNADAYAMPFSDASFDVVVATQFVHMLEDPARFFCEARRVLVPGGLLLVMDQRRDMVSPLYAAMWATTWLIRVLRIPLEGMGPVTDACYTAAELEAALAEAGFEGRIVVTGPIRLEARGTV